ncbi:MAG: glycosyltransferase family 4 protein [Bacteroidia bacterium]|jgi:glycosyltransferase involved in cell wall biosynthesis|nr:glycosyltransferase family 4 protein [Bacteroidia bacterium]
MKSVIFIGTYLSAKKGTISIPEKLKLLFNGKVNIYLSSNKENKLWRLIDISINLLFKKYSTAFFDVFSGNAFIITEVGTILAKWKRKKIVLTLRGGKLAEFSGENENRLKMVFNRADIIQTPSYFLKSHFESWGYSINYLPNGVDLEKFPYLPNKTNGLKLLWVRGFSEIYNPLIAVRTLHILKTKFPKITLTMVGPDGGMLHLVKEEIQKLKLEQSITLTGPVPNHQLRDYYHSHQIYLNTTSYESFGTAIIEAAACGIPIVSSNVGEIPYLWKHKENIMLTEELDQQHFAYAVETLLEDPELSFKLSKQAKIKAESFDWHNLTPVWNQLFNQ